MLIAFFFFNYTVPSPKHLIENPSPKANCFPQVFLSFLKHTLWGGERGEAALNWKMLGELRSRCWFWDRLALEH